MRYHTVLLTVSLLITTAISIAGCGSDSDGGDAGKSGSSNAGGTAGSSGAGGNSGTGGGGGTGGASGGGSGPGGTGGTGPAVTVLISVDSNGKLADVVGSSYPSVSADGRYVAFQSSATNLVPNDTNELQDVFLRDTLTGTTTRVSVDSAGNQGNDQSVTPKVSADGRFVAFISSATNLVTGDNNVARDAFLHDMSSGTTIRLSVDANGKEGSGGENVLGVSMSPDGRFIAFDSEADLVPTDTIGSRWDVYLLDRENDTLRLLSGAAQGNSDSMQSFVSADGHFVVFRSAGALVADDTNELDDIYLHDMNSNITTRVSLGPAGIQLLDGNSGLPSVSNDGRYVAFWSGAPNLVADDTNGFHDIFMRDIQSSITSRVSLTAQGAQAMGGAAAFPSLASDGRSVAFSSLAPGLVPEDSNTVADVFFRSSDTGRTSLVSVNRAGTSAVGGDQVSLSADGRFVTFVSHSDDLVAGDDNGINDIFLRGPLF